MRKLHCMLFHVFLDNYDCGGYYTGHNGTCYRHIAQSYTYGHAMLYCANDGGHLASIESESVQDFVEGEYFMFLKLVWTRSLGLTLFDFSLCSLAKQRNNAFGTVLSSICPSICLCFSCVSHETFSKIYPHWN